MFLFPFQPNLCTSLQVWVHEVLHFQLKTLHVINDKINKCWIFYIKNINININILSMDYFKTHLKDFK
jgi:hypothetical protein